MSQNNLKQAKMHQKESLYQPEQRPILNYANTQNEPKQAKRRPTTS